MMIPRFFCPLPNISPGSVELPSAVAHHALRVLRLKAGDPLVLFDGTGGEYDARLEIDGKAARARIIEWRDVERESPLDMTLAQALPAGEKMDWVVQKAVELGVRRIVPLQAARCVLRLTGERAQRRVEHWRQVAVAASEQCGRNRIAMVEAVMDLRAFLAAGGSDAVKLICAPGARMSVATVACDRPLVLLVGPEGGFADDEAATARAAGFQALMLGPRVLRTETAGLAALAALGALHGDLSGPAPG